MNLEFFKRHNSIWEYFALRFERSANNEFEFQQKAPVPLEILRVFRNCMINKEIAKHEC